MFTEEEDGQRPRLHGDAGKTAISAGILPYSTPAPGYAALVLLRRGKVQPCLCFSCICIYIRRGRACGAGKAPAANDNAVVAEINGETITLADLDERIAGELYEVRSNALEELIRERVFESEAESRGVSVEQLLETEAAAVGEISDEEVAAFFE